MQSSTINLQRANSLRFILPFILCAIVVGYETKEHVFESGGSLFDPNLSLEILFFGILGPTAVYFVLTYVVSLLKHQTALNVNLGKMNRDLEGKVAERTNTLEINIRELALANSELQQLDDLKSDFVALVSHELRGPLTTLNGGIELALEDSNNLPADSRRVLEILALESERLTNFVQTILDLSRIDAGKLKLVPGPVSISRILQHIVDFQNLERETDLSLDIQENIPLAWADEMALEKALSNIIANAIKYSVAGAPVQINALSSKGKIEIAVTDYGPGIPKESQLRIFNRFQRLDSGDQISTDGWGLGLYFAKVLTESQGGQMTILSPARNDDNAPGAIFSISLPQMKEQDNEK